VPRDDILIVLRLAPALGRRSVASCGSMCLQPLLPEKRVVRLRPDCRNRPGADAFLLRRPGLLQGLPGPDVRPVAADRGVWLDCVAGSRTNSSLCRGATTGELVWGQTASNSSAA